MKFCEVLNHFDTKTRIPTATLAVYTGEPSRDLYTDNWRNTFCYKKQRNSYYNFVLRFITFLLAITINI